MNPLAVQLVILVGQALVLAIGPVVAFIAWLRASMRAARLERELAELRGLHAMSLSVQAATVAHLERALAEWNASNRAIAAAAGVDLGAPHPATPTASPRELRLRVLYPRAVAEGN